MNKIKLVSFYTKDLVELKDLFINSIKDDWDVEVVEIEPIDGDSNIGSEQYYKIINTKNKFIAKKISENIGNIIIFSDIDVVFLNKSNEYILELLGNNDLLIQSNGPMINNKLQINSGFIVIKCNLKTLIFFSHTSEIEKNNIQSNNKKTDQHIIQDELYKNFINLKWNVLPNSFYNVLLGENRNLDDVPTNIYIFHAIMTFKKIENGVIITSLEQKINILKTIIQKNLHIPN